MTARPAVVAFDVIETLMSIEPLRARLAGAGCPPHLLETWYARILRDGMALSAAGDYADFPSVAEAALRSLTGRPDADERLAAVIADLGDLPAFPDALPAVTRLAEAGVRVACLTNGRADTTAAFAARAGLEPFIERVISAAEVFRWKPSAVVYRYAAEVLGVRPERMALVAAHDWDCHGAKRAGMTTGWVRRPSGLPGGYGACFTPPDVAGADLAEVAAKLLALEP
jgi:2-haloacid dehalogenase